MPFRALTPSPLFLPLSYRCSAQVSSKGIPKALREVLKASVHLASELSDDLCTLLPRTSPLFSKSTYYMNDDHAFVQWAKRMQISALCFLLPLLRRSVTLFFRISGLLWLSHTEGIRFFCSLLPWKYRRRRLVCFIAHDISFGLPLA